MEIFILYDNGNTTHIANAMFEELNKQKFSVKIKHVDHAKKDDLIKTDLLIVGSPTKSWKPTKKIQNYFLQFKNYDFRSKNAACFGLTEKKLFASSSSKHIQKYLQMLRFNIIAQPEDFYQEDNKVSKEELLRVKKYIKYIWMY